MPYSVTHRKSGQPYFLHEHKEQVKSGHQVTIYFFEGETREGALEEVPTGYEVGENPLTGRPILRRKQSAS